MSTEIPDELGARSLNKQARKSGSGVDLEGSCCAASRILLI